MRLTKEVFFENLGPQVGANTSARSILGSIHTFLEEIYSGTDRHYHNLEHINQCIKHLFEFKNTVDPSVYGNSQAIFSALWFHDIIYVPGSKLNEIQSALIAEAVFISLDINKSFIKNVKNLILITKHDRLPMTNEEKLIVDIDLLGLAEPWGKFCENEENICKEFSSLCNREEFMMGQQEFLKRFLARAKIFHTPYFHDLYEEKAQENLRRFIKL